MPNLDIPYKPFAKQCLFHYSPKKYRGLIGGIGSGKTKAGVQEIFRICSKYPGVNGIVVAPTYRMLHDVTRLEFLSVCLTVPGLIREFNKSEDTVTLATGNTVFFRSAENPEKLRGPNVGWFYADESALMHEMAWQILIGRLRLAPGLGWTTTTPKGKNWLYEVFGHEDDEHFMVNVRSDDNPHLPSGFVHSLRNSYTSQFAAQEVEGQFIDTEGSLAKREWFQLVDVLPNSLRFVRAWDFAATEKSAKSNDPDFTAGAKVGVLGGNYYIAHMVHTRAGPGAVEALVRQIAELDGKSMPIICEQEPGSAGKLFTASLIRALAGWPIEARPASGDKVARAMPWLAQAQAGNVYVLRGEWTSEFIDEIVSFPIGSHDDQCDAVSAAFAKLTASATVATARGRTVTAGKLGLE